MGSASPALERWCQSAYSALEVASEPTFSPGEARRVIMEQHERIRTLLRRIERRATRLLATQVPTASEREATRRSALALCAVMAWHIEEENRILLPLLECADAWGPVRAGNLRADHEQQLLLLRAYASALELPGGSGAALGLIAWQLVEIISEDMQHEEADVLSSAGLRDDACFGGDGEDA